MLCVCCTEMLCIASSNNVLPSAPKLKIYRAELVPMLFAYYLIFICMYLNGIKVLATSAMYIHTGIVRSIQNILFRQNQAHKYFMLYT